MDLRIAAAFALARMHTQQALPYLAILLADPSPSLKTAAIGGLASFANNVPIGSHQPAAGAWQYRTDDTIAHSAFDEATVERQESYYITFWTGWWQQNQKTLAQ
jgi:HEAT repeat protein